jgi:hypothetical protein
MKSVIKMLCLFQCDGSLAADGDAEGAEGQRPGRSGGDKAENNSAAATTCGTELKLAEKQHTDLSQGHRLDIANPSNWVGFGWCSAGAFARHNSIVQRRHQTAG